MKHIVLKTVFLFIGLFVFFTSNAQTMTTIEILQNLKPYVTFLEELKHSELSNVKNQEGFVELRGSVSNQYNFITVRLHCVTSPLNDDRKSFDERLLCEVRFEIVNDKIVLKEVYHEKPLRNTAIVLSVQSNKKISDVSWQTKVEHPASYLEYLQYLTAADQIASLAMNCASGDNYRPGFYSQIEIGEEYIWLTQNNHMNSRSLDHKENYSMRKLKFWIPLIEHPEQTRMFDYTIDAMKLEFSDHSSANNRACGDRIEDKIKELSSSWKK